MTTSKTVQDFIFFGFKSLILGALTCLIASQVVNGPLWISVTGVFLLGVFISLGGIYRATVWQIRRLRDFQNRGFLYRLFSGRPLKVIAWVVWALVSAYFMLLQFHSYSLFDWGMYGLVIPLFWIIFRLTRHVISGQFRPYQVTARSLEWSCLLTPVIIILLTLLFASSFAQIPLYASLDEAIKAQKPVTMSIQSSALIWETLQTFAIYGGAREYVLGNVGIAHQSLALVLFVPGSYVVLYNTCLILSALMIPRLEYRRVFGPLSETDTAAPVATSRVALVSGFVFFIAAFIFIPLVGALEAWVEASPEFSRARERLEIKVEQIGDVFYATGTLDKIQAARNSTLRKNSASLASLHTKIDDAFIRVETNIDDYLDWYYSLVGEYTRITALLLGELEKMMADKLRSVLLQGNIFQEVDSEMARLFKDNEIAQLEYQHQLNSILSTNRINPAQAPVHIVSQTSFAEVMNPPVHTEIIDLRKRLTASGGSAAIAGALTALMANKIVAKVIGKNLIKVAAKGLSKVIVSKAAGGLGGTATGALAGATAGSIVPGIGTVVGAVIGGAMGGLVVGLTVDKLLLELEESVNRENFKTEILAVINETRREFKGELDR